MQQDCCSWLHIPALLSQNEWCVTTEKQRKTSSIFLWKENAMGIGIKEFL